MALRGDRWFLGECFDEYRRGTVLKGVAERCLELGLRGEENTQGHIRQACGALQKFFEKYPQHKTAIRKTKPKAYEPTGQILVDWKRFFGAKRGKGAQGIGGSRFGYS